MINHGEDVLKTLADDYVTLVKDANTIQAEITEREGRKAQLTIKQKDVVSKLLQYVGESIPERYVVVGNILIRISYGSRNVSIFTYLK